MSSKRRIHDPSSLLYHHPSPSPSPAPHHHHHHHHHRHHPPPPPPPPHRRHHHHYDSSSAQEHHQKAQENPPPDDRLVERIQIDLFDIYESTTGRPQVKIGAKRKTANLDHVASFLKGRFYAGDEAIPHGDRIEFFHLEKQLHGSELPQHVAALSYRVVNPQDDGSLEVRWKGTHQSVRLFPSQLDEVARYIRSGATIGQVRHKVASELAGSLSTDSHSRATIEPDQIVIEAVGGFRQGLLQGDSWECRNVRSWLCRRLAITLVRPDAYFVFYGFNERYVLHGPHLDYYHDTQGTMNGSGLKMWLRRKLLTNVRQPGDHPGKIKAEDISLSIGGRRVRDGTPFRSGMSFDFELSRDARTIFIQAEAWLLPLTETCSICADDKRVSEMPNQRSITRDCAHAATACSDCIGQWITRSMETVSWDRLKCPECPNLLSFQDVEAFAPRDTFDRYDRLATRAALDRIAGFRWCLNPKCDSGQIYPSGCEKAKCHACQRSSCVRHDVPWHSGETCKEYDKRTRKQRKSYKLSEKHIQKTTKTCPGCKRHVNKYSGCDHITCPCGHEWCWLCFATYTRDRSSKLSCKHKTECRHHRTPPFWEGGGANFILEDFLDRPPAAAMGRRPAIPLRQPPGVRVEDAAAERPAPNRPESPHMPAPALLNFLFEELNNGVGPRLRRQGMPFINDALLFDLAQLMQRAR
ncbi:hypothetical protein F4825DRAFT_312853 [Nemania diffusa]|nr:hypothetical protein F4825DRAFT_312853 [Nemania diffusa]